MRFCHVYPNRNPKLQSDLVELKLFTSTGGVGLCVTSIGPGGIEMLFVGPARREVYLLQSDLVELKYPTTSGESLAIQDFNRTWWN